MTPPYNVRWEEEMVINFILLQWIFKSFIVNSIADFLDISKVEELTTKILNS